MIITRLDKLADLVDQQRRERNARPQDCEIRLSQDALIDLMAEAYPQLNRFELDAKADSIATLYGAHVVIDDTAEAIAITVTTPLTPGAVEAMWQAT